MGSQITMSTIKALSPFKPCFLVFLSILLIETYTYKQYITYSELVIDFLEWKFERNYMKPRANEIS